MAKNAVIPSLSADGWIDKNNPKKMLDTMFAYTLSSNYSQSTVFKGSITSLNYLFASFQNNPPQLVIELEDAYTTYFKRVFDTADVQCAYIMSPNNSSTYTVTISVTVTLNNETFDLATTASVDNGVLKTTLLNSV